MSAKDVAKFVESLYEGPVSLKDLQARVLNAAHGSEVGGPTADKDQKIQDMIFSYVQSNSASIPDRHAKSFAAILAWICVGKEISKFLALVPRGSLEGLISAAKKSGFEVEVADAL